MARFYIRLLVGFSLLHSGCAGYSSFEKGQIFYNMRKYPEAISEWEKVSPHDKNYLEAQLKISQTTRELQERATLVDHYLQTGKQLEKAGDLRSAMEMYEKAAEVNPFLKNLLREEIERLLAKKDILIQEASRSGEVFFKRKDYQKARTEWRKVLRLDPDNPQAQQYLKEIDLIVSSNDQIFYSRGIKLYRQGLINAAKQEFESALKINPHNPKTAQYLDAISKVNHVLYTSKKGDTLPKIAKSYTQNTEDAKILSDFNNLSTTSKVNPGTTLKIPLIKGFKTAILKEKPDSEAEELPVETVTKQGLSSEDKFLSPLLHEGIVLYTEGDYEKALVAFEKVLAEDPDNYEASRYILFITENLKEKDAQAKIEPILERGLFYKEQQEYAEAIAEFEKVLNLDPSHVQAKIYLDESREALQKQAAFHLNEGIRYFNDQQLEKAIAEWDKVLAINPDNQKAKDYQKRAFTMLEKLRTLQNSQNRTLE